MIGPISDLLRAMLASNATRCLLPSAIALFSASCQPAAPETPGPGIDPTAISPETPVWELLVALGETAPEHIREGFTEAQVQRGYELVTSGKTPHPETGILTERLSAYFYCTDCHTSVREESSLRSLSDPEAKIAYATENGLPLLPGTTFAGIVNRSSWYNGDYARKYRFSPSVRRARKSLTAAIILCTEQCSQGRSPETWEVEAMLAYFWSLQWKLGDLGLRGADIAEWKRRAINPDEHETLRQEIRARFVSASPATFGAMPEDPVAGYQVDSPPSPDRGKQVWERTCLHCHGAEGASEHFFGDKEATWKSLSRKFRTASSKSVYGYLRLGTHPEDEKKAYMPNYTRERLSDQQIEDLRSYIEERAGSDESAPADSTGTE